MSESQKGTVKRKITVEECIWLESDIEEGSVVYLYRGHTYGCISDNGVAVSDKPGEEPFYELPADAVSWDN